MNLNQLTFLFILKPRLLVYRDRVPKSPTPIVHFYLVKGVTWMARWHHGGALKDVQEVFISAIELYFQEI